MPICKFYQSGYCSYGDSCRNEHIDQGYSRGSHRYGSYSYEDEDDYDDYDYGYDERHVSNSPINQLAPKTSNLPKYGVSTAPHGTPPANAAKNPYKWVSPLYKNYNRGTEGKQTELKAAAFNDNYGSRSRHGSGDTRSSSRTSTTSEHHMHDRGEGSQRSSRRNSRLDQTPIAKSDFKNDSKHWVSPMYKAKLEAGERTGTVYKSLTVNTVVKEVSGEPSPTLSETGVILEDMKMWEKGMRYPFSSYGLWNKPSAFNIPDISPEEFRVEYNSAKRTNLLDKYQKNWHNLQLCYSDMRHQIIAAAENVNRTVLTQANFKTEFGDCFPKDFLTEPIKTALTKTTSTAATEAPVNFKFNSTARTSTEKPQFGRNPTVSQTDTPKFGQNPAPEKKNIFGQKQSGAIPNFNFANTKPAPAGPPPLKKEEYAIDLLPTYSQKENLTEQELAEFMADNFTLANIPTRPPPKELCR